MCLNLFTVIHTLVKLSGLCRSVDCGDPGKTQYEKDGVFIIPFRL